MHSLLFFFLFVLENAVIAFAHPLHGINVQSQKRNSYEKRENRRARAAGLGVGLTILFIILLVLTFEVGRRCERNGSWRFWREAPRTNILSTSDTISRFDERSPIKDLKSRYNTDSPMQSPSAPFELQSPDNYNHNRPRRLELPTKEVYEMGQPTPHQLTPREMGLPTPRLTAERRSWVRRTWWRHRPSEQQQQQQQQQHQQHQQQQQQQQQQQARSISALDMRPTSALSCPQPAYPNVPRRSKSERKGRKSTGNLLMNFEQARKLYEQKEERP